MFDLNETANKFEHYAKRDAHSTENWSKAYATEPHNYALSSGKNNPSRHLAEIFEIFPENISALRFRFPQFVPSMLRTENVLSRKDPLPLIFAILIFPLYISQ